MRFEVVDEWESASIWTGVEGSWEAVGCWAVRYRWQDLIAMLPFLLPVWI